MSPQPPADRSRLTVQYLPSGQTPRPDPSRRSDPSDPHHDHSRRPVDGRHHHAVARCPRPGPPRRRDCSLADRHRFRRRPPGDSSRPPRHDFHCHHLPTGPRLPSPPPSRHRCRSDYRTSARRYPHRPGRLSSLTARGHVLDRPHAYLRPYLEGRPCATRRHRQRAIGGHWTSRPGNPLIGQGRQHHWSQGLVCRVGARRGAGRSRPDPSWVVGRPQQNSRDFLSSHPPDGLTTGVTHVRVEHGQVFGDAERATPLGWPFLKGCSAATYSPTQSPVQYHRRRRA